ncbi:hypothetical protein ncot_08995 [Nocardioides sp. JQ2195]|uniref:hypothetical protein n=1 Tax=Nocardioides sp. JQ2195 TaxID=2592334 RepID=UPI00143E8D8F|nr:hypothetical protein [Nocardioides sp. JQ2195]QIX26724.1 hypothetical protein ncot_08995 [Nocardioides sp. JQ2195]
MSASDNTGAPPRAYGVLLLVLATGLFANAVLGPLALRVLTYPVTETVTNQLIGMELVTILLVVPWTVWAAVGALRGSRLSPLLGFAPSAYAAYMLVQYVLGPEYAHYSVAVLAHLAGFVLAAALAWWSWHLSVHAVLPQRTAARDRLAGVLLLCVAAMVALRYTGALAGSVTEASLPAEFMEERTFFWSILLLDLGVVVPLTVASAIALLRGAAVGSRALHAVVGWFALVPPSVAAMALVMVLKGDENASLPTTLLLGVVSVALGAVAWRMFLAARHLPASQPEADDLTTAA